MQTIGHTRGARPAGRAPRAGGRGGIGAGMLAAADGRRPVRVRVEAAVRAAAGK